MIIEPLLEELRRHLTPTDSLVLVHAAPWRFLDPSATPHDYLETLLTALAPTQTLLLPTFTFSFTKTGRFDLRDTRSEVGDLSNEFLALEGVLRSSHPIYSFAARGPRAAEVAERFGETCFGAGSVFELLEHDDARVVMVGATMVEHCTLHHRAEELAAVPYRFFKSFSGTVSTGGADARPTEATFFVRRLDLPNEYDFRVAAKRLEPRESFVRTEYGRGTIESAGAQDIVQSALETLREDPFSPLLDPERVRRLLAATPLRLAGGANLAVLERHVRAELEARDLLDVRVQAGEYGDYAQLGLDPTSDLHADEAGDAVFLVRLEDLIGPYLEQCWLAGSEPDVDVVLERVAGYASIVEQLAESSRWTITVADFRLALEHPDGAADSERDLSLERLERACNDLLEERVFRAHPKILRFPFARTLGSFGLAAARPGKYHHLARIPFSPAFSSELARRIVDFMLIRRGRTAKAVVVDLDDTLWGGVLGDVGEAGIALSADYPGSVYRELQRYLKGLSRRGVILAIASRNEEEPALRTLDTHPEMLLRSADFAAHRINWDNKADNLRAIAEDINIGLDAICFLDENPNERALIRRFLPQVIVPELPEDPAEWVDFLRDRWELQALRVTNEDRNRSSTIRTAVDIRRRSAEVVDLDDFLRSLELSVDFEPLGDGNRERIAQLHAKTNQFNATTRRYGSTELDALEREGALVYGVRTSGKFDPSEVNAALVLVPATHDGEPAFEIASLLYSCRMAGRRLEDAILAFAAESAREHGARYLLGEIVETERNAPIRGLYDREGFEQLADGRRLVDLQTVTIPTPDCYAVAHA